MLWMRKNFSVLDAPQDLKFPARVGIFFGSHFGRRKRTRTCVIESANACWAFWPCPTGQIRRVTVGFTTTFDLVGIASRWVDREHSLRSGDGENILTITRHKFGTELLIVHAVLLALLRFFFFLLGLICTVSSSKTPSRGFSGKVSDSTVVLFFPPILSDATKNIVSNKSTLETIQFFFQVDVALVHPFEMCVGLGKLIL